MRLRLPPVWVTDEVGSDLGTIRQLLEPGRAAEGRLVPFKREKDVGHALLDEAGNTTVLVFARRPRTAPAGAGSLTLLSKSFPQVGDEVDLSDGTWLSHPRMPSGNPAWGRLASDARDSWVGAFRFAEEDVARGTVGLRRPQIGALHAIHAHWSTSTETATVVMPTGTGKTETMLSTLVSMRCPRVLVVVPTDALRTQIAEKFETLGILKVPGNAVLATSAHCPVVGTLEKRPRSVSEVDAFVGACNVVVTTSALLGGCPPEVQARLGELCSHLFIDEAHHAEAPTWKEFRQRFIDRTVLQFTATPFREDGQKIDGKLIYVYPLRQAQEEGYFRPIRFREVHEFVARRGDEQIALAALDELDADTTGKHIVMARVNGVERATAIHDLYSSIGRHEVVVVHSKVPSKERAAAKAKLFSGQARVVVCVDMLGEGFDLPELKIAAFHDIRKSLAVTLQLAGRFTRSRPDLGDPVFIANTALIDVGDELRTLYSQDPDWNLLLPALSSTAIDEEVASQTFFRGFSRFISEVPLKDLRPAASMVVYRTNCANWTPKRFRKGFRGLTPRDRLYHSLNEHENTLVVLAATEHGVRWSDVETIRQASWELLIAVWDRERHLLYLHGSDISGTYRELAKALCGDDVELLTAPSVYRCFHGIKRLTLNNVGLDEHLGRQVRYTGRMGSDVEARIGQAARQGATKSVLAGKGFERGNRVSVGAAKRGRVWSSQRLRVDGFASWARSLGAKFVDGSIDPDEVLAGTLKPVAVGTVPSKVVVAIEWPSELLMRPEHLTNFQAAGHTEVALSEVEISAAERDADGPLVVNLSCDAWQVQLTQTLVTAGNGFDFRFSQTAGPRLGIRRGQASESLDEFFTEYPPVVWFADGSSLEGCEYVELPSASLAPFPKERMAALDWSGVDIRKESQGEQRTPGTIQHRLIQVLQSEPSYEVIFDDDGSGEAADVVTVRTLTEGDRKVIEVEFFHCKYSRGAPGARVDDLYVVCGQAQRSVSWLASHEKRTELFTHLLRRNARRTDQGLSSRFERGDVSTLMALRDMSRRFEVRFRVAVVQPGVSVASASSAQLRLLAVTERYLTDTYEVPLRVLCSQ